MILLEASASGLLRAGYGFALFDGCRSGFLWRDEQLEVLAELLDGAIEWVD